MNPAMQADDTRLTRLITRQAQKRHLAALWAAAAGIAPGMIVLDIGAGSGALSFEYAALVAPGGRIIAIDPDAECIAHINEQATNRALPLHAITGTAEALPPLPAPPDRVMLTDALHHMNDPTTALRRLHAIMPPHAILFIAEYDPAGAGAMGAKLSRRTAPATVAALLAAAGFTIQAQAAAPDEHYTITAIP
ncbi:class I SAM-dependent methyltransferase [Acidiphilium angustum]|uniref:Methyltransferase, FkbM family n=2 Tax=Acidiphilium rubrum TaxID=526 RepID=A0A8G2CI92_ACIRU|nr:class I SAM-dependent methyltransferase [Acidiphilium angustum]SIQ21147.1 methyltransferase, FkbM family [Acidiphilium rubrum]